MKSVLNQIDAALMSLKVVKAEKQVDLVVFEHCQGNLNHLVTSKKFHVCEMHSTKDFRRANTDGHACKSSVQLVQDSTLFSTSLTNNRALGTTIDESLDRRTVDLSIDIEHGDIAEEFWIVLHCLLVVILNHLLANIFFDQFLSFSVVRVSVTESDLALLLSFLLGHDFLQSVSDQTLDLIIVVGCQSG